MTDATGGVIDRAAYDSFGNGTVSSITRYAYTGREWDEEAGLYYYRARWYDSQQGRFISEDPIGLEGGINLYGYVENDPVNAIDPLGQDGIGIDRTRPRRGRRARGAQVPTPPVTPIIDPPPPIQPPPPTATPTPPWTPSGPTTPPSSPTKDCDCETAVPRWPDFYSLSGSIPIPTPWTGSSFGWSGTLTIDRNWSVYFSTGPVIAFPSAGGGALNFGWLNQRCKPKPEQLNNFLSNGSVSFAGYTPWFFGGGETWSPGNGTATFVGLGGPAGGSVSGSWGWRLR